MIEREVLRPEDMPKNENEDKHFIGNVKEETDNTKEETDNTKE